MSNLITFLCLALILILEGNPPTPDAGVPPRELNFDCGSSTGGLCFCWNPDRVDPTPPKIQPRPDIALSLNPSNWGTVEVTPEGEIKIEGHPDWHAVGCFRANGTVLLQWTTTCEEEEDYSGPGVYTVGRTGILDGSWGFDGDVTVEADGSLAGDVRQDRIYKLLPE